MPESLDRFFFRSLLLIIICTGLAAFAVYHIALSFYADARASEATRLAHFVTAGLERYLETQRAHVRQLLSQPDLGPVFRRMRVDESVRRAQRLGSLLPRASGVHFIEASRLDSLAPPAGVDGECWSYLKRVAENPAQPAPVEFHDVHAPTEHYDVVETVTDNAGRARGYAVILFPSEPLDAWLNDAQQTSNAGIELIQTRLDTKETIVGDRTRHAKLPPTQAFVSGTLWHVRLRLPEETTNPFSLSRTAYFILLVIALAWAFGIVIKLRQRLKRAIGHDTEILANLLDDVRRGNVRTNYPVRLKEFTNVFHELRTSGQRLVEEKQKLMDMGLVDHLSQLSNRRHFESRLTELFERRQRLGPSSLLIIDIDHFKPVNDEYGHDAGDALVAEFAAALRRCVRQADFLARLGGDEFCVIYPHTSLTAAATFADRLRRQLPREIELPRGIKHPLRWTGGLSVMRETDSKFDDVLWRADQALFKAKEAGRHTTRVLDPEAAKNHSNA